MDERKAVSCYIITKYTSPNKTYENHAIDNDGKPLCGILKGRKQYLSLEYNYADDKYTYLEVTCKRCLKLINKE